MLSHESIVKFYGYRKSGTRQYLFLEYASGGELFDRIGEVAQLKVGSLYAIRSRPGFSKLMYLRDKYFPMSLWGHSRVT